MTFTVIWRPSAEQKLAEIWAEVFDRQAIADAEDFPRRTSSKSWIR